MVRVKRKGVSVPMRTYLVRFLGVRAQSNDVAYNRPMLPPGKEGENQLQGGDMNVASMPAAFPQHAARHVAKAYFPDAETLVSDEAVFAVHDPITFKLYFYKFFGGIVEANEIYRYPHFALRMVSFGVLFGVLDFKSFKGHVRSTTGEFIDRPGSGVVSMDSLMLANEEAQQSPLSSLLPNDSFQSSGQSSQPDRRHRRRRHRSHHHRGDNTHAYQERTSRLQSRRSSYRREKEGDSTSGGDGHSSASSTHSSDESTISSRIIRAASDIAGLPRNLY